MPEPKSKSMWFIHNGIQFKGQLTEKVLENGDIEVTIVARAVDEVASYG